MVETDLSKEMIEAGAKLIRCLDDCGMRPDAFWFYFTDVGAWKLVLADASVGETGPKAVYRQIQKTLDDANGELAPLELDHVTLARPDSPIVALLRTVVHTGPDIAGVRFTRNVVNGTFIEDAYIYRLS
jgi:hypothetical protein